MLFYFVIFLGFIPFAFPVSSDFNTQLLKAQNSIYHLQLVDADIRLKAEIKIHPDRVSAFYLQELSSFLKAFISETRTDMEASDKIRNLAVSHLEKLPKSDPYREFLLSELSLHKGLLLLKSANYSMAALAFKDAYQKSGIVIKKHPDFLPAYKSLALLETVAAHLGPSYQWVIRLAGINTDYHQNLIKVNSFIDQPQTGPFEWFKKESALMTGYLYWHIQQREKAWNIIKLHTTDYNTNPLSRYFLAVFAHKKNLNEYCLSILTGYHPKSPEMRIPFLSYLKGICQLQKLDSACLGSFEEFRKWHRGMHYIKASYLRSAWGSLIFGNILDYREHMKKLKYEGKTISEEDKQAMTESERSNIPHIKLLKTRLLFDGGYFRDALKIIQPLKASDFKSVLEKTEYCYRKGRIYHALGQNQLAIAFYEAAISTGSALEVYYAAYSCLFLAEIYEGQGNRNQAIEYYKKANGFKNNTEYVQTIEQKSATGIRRLKLK